MTPAPWPSSELVRLAWAARRDPLARQHLLQAFQEGADFHTPLSSSDLNDDLFAVPGDCLAGVVIRELTGVKDAEEWLHAFHRACALHLELPKAETPPPRRRF
ncbi:hypothetical protein JAK52_09450 [Stenotrophomonas maltophilia]|uniref:hypothetical protein n=1 Tax=Stenotrophomonas maltophilia TaxID=40324 RepID=UPI0021C5F20C|nr:hypothetical protein [Stenotrophomonas maltophilia]MCU1174717.1 hypothetical protein [Stenotrophomonas maltophilia]